jgi:hypothetical protein
MFDNGDTLKQLLARSRYFPYTRTNQSGQNQTERASYYLNCILTFKAYDLAQDLRNIFEKQIKLLTFKISQMA